MSDIFKIKAKFPLALLPKLPPLPVVETPTGRYYQIPTGEWVPSVTTCWSQDKSLEKGLAKWVKDVGVEESERIKTEATTVGNHMHQFLEDFLLHKRDLSPFPRNNSGDEHLYLGECLAGMIGAEINKHVTSVLGVESALYSTQLGIAGRIDALVMWDGVPTILDFKNAKEIKPEKFIQKYFWQTTIYAMMVREIYGIDVQQVVIAMGSRDRQYKFWKKNTSDYETTVCEKIPEYKKTIPAYNP